MRQLRVSVVIPTHNRAALLREAIESALAQSVAPHEVVVCDDGSTDQTEELARACGSPVRYVALTHTGRPGAPRNRGVQSAESELVAFLDDDDLWEPEKLERQLERIGRRPHVGLVYCDRRLLFPDGSRSAPVLSLAEKRGEDLLSLLLDARFPQLSTVLVRRELLLRVGGFDETLTTGEDLDLLLRLARAAEVECVPEPLVLVRRDEASLSGRSGPAAYRNAMRILGRELGGGGLSRSNRSRCRGTLARLGVSLARMLADSGDLSGARRAAFAALRHRPVSPAGWRAAARVLLRGP